MLSSVQDSSPANASGSPKRIPLTATSLRQPTRSGCLVTQNCSSVEATCPTTRPMASDSGP